MRRFGAVKRVADGAVQNASIIRAARAMSYLAADPMRQPVIVSAVRTPIGRCACLAMTGSLCGVLGCFRLDVLPALRVWRANPELGPRDTARFCISAPMRKFLPFCGAV